MPSGSVGIESSAAVVDELNPYYTRHGPLVSVRKLSLG